MNLTSPGIGICSLEIYLNPSSRLNSAHQPLNFFYIVEEINLSCFPNLIRYAHLALPKPPGQHSVSSQPPSPPQEPSWGSIWRTRLLLLSGASLGKSCSSLIHCLSGKVRMCDLICLEFSARKTSVCPLDLTCFIWLGDSLVLSHGSFCNGGKVLFLCCLPYGSHQPQ